MKNIVTNDIKEFGMRERLMARELLATYGTKKDKTNFLSDGINVFMNKNSGYVFLSDEEYNVAMMNGDVLEDFVNCPECGHEDFYSEFRKHGNDCCQEYADDMGFI